MKKIDSNKIPKIQCDKCNIVVPPDCFFIFDGQQHFYYPHFCKASFTIDELDKMEGLDGKES